MVDMVMSRRVNSGKRANLGMGGDVGSGGKGNGNKKTRESKKHRKLVKELDKIIRKKVREHQETVQKILEYFKCYHCGKCCEVPIVVKKKEASLISKVTGMAISDFSIDIKETDKFRVMYPCTFREKTTKRCHIYDIRPLVCRMYPFDASVPILQGLGVSCSAFIFCLFVHFAFLLMRI